MFFVANTPPVAADIVYQRLSAAAYLEPKLAEISVGDIGYKLVAQVFDSATGADAIVVRNDDEVVVAFRGTERNYADIMTDLKFKRHRAMMTAHDHLVPVHRGFLSQWRAIKNDLHIVIGAVTSEKKLKRNLSLKVTGHSLGGALAVLATIDWPRVDDCITFGAPRVGDDTIVYAMRRNHVLHRRYVFGADVVPVVPLLALGYRHDCSPIYLTRTGKPIRNCPLWREALGRARALLSLRWCKGWTMWPVPTRMFSDHRIGAYGSVMAKCKR